ncbi:MAG: DMT family transporter [Parachlamydiales bacterium]|nr:DMT family transporter [Parachlamydiales bacterium]
MSLVFLTYAIWSSCFTIGKATLAVSAPLFLTGTRMIVAAAILIAYVIIFNPKSLKLNKRQWLFIGLLGIFSIFIANALEFWGLQFLTAGKTCLIYSLTPFISAVLSYFQFGEKITYRKWIGLLIGFTSFIPIALEEKGLASLRNEQWSLVSMPELALVGAAIAAAYGWILLKKLGGEEAVSPITANGFSMLFGGILALLASGYFESWNPIPVSDSKIFLQGVFLNILVSNILCYNLYGFLLKKFSATFISFAGLTTPLFAALFGWAYLGEKIGLFFYIAIAIIGAGLFVVYMEERRLGYIKTKAIK